MKIEIKNLAKLEEASLDINGITVIAGENNTGKSTIGKALFAFFNASLGIDQQIEKSRRRAIHKQLSFFIYRNIDPSKSPINVLRQINKCLDNKHIEKDDILNIIRKITPKLTFESIAEEEINFLTNNINEYRKWPSEKLKLEIFTERFNSIFNNQINTLSNKKSNAIIRIIVKETLNELKFQENTCYEAICPTIISNSCIYIDDPLILDECGSNLRYSDYKKRETINFLEQYFEKIDKNDSEYNLLETSIIKSKMKDIFSKLNSITNGKVIEKNGIYCFRQKESKEDLNLNNLSTGLKSVVILKMLIEKTLLEDRDLLILDEPEIHLHPKWQIVYAEIIVLLQKALNLHVVITTHSPYFLDAIELYSRKHDIHSKFKCYTSDLNNSNKITFIDVTNNLEKAYEKLAYPVTELNELRYELSYLDK